MIPKINEGWILCSRCAVSTRVRLPHQYTAAQNKFFVGMVQSTEVEVLIVSTYNGHAFNVTRPETAILAGCGGRGRMSMPHGLKLTQIWSHDSTCTFASIIKSALNNFQTYWQEFDQNLII